MGNANMEHFQKANNANNRGPSLFSHSPPDQGLATYETRGIRLPDDNSISQGETIECSADET